MESKKIDTFFNRHKIRKTFIINQFSKTCLRHVAPACFKFLLNLEATTYFTTHLFRIRNCLAPIAILVINRSILLTKFDFLLSFQLLNKPENCS